MARFCANCGAQMADTATTCPACGKGAGQSAGGGAAAAPAAQTGGLQDNLASALAYLFVPAIIFLVMEPYNRNKTIRFHAFQGIFLGLAVFVLNSVIAFVPIVNFFLLLLGPAEFVLWVILFVMALQGKTIRIPVIADFAQQQADAV